MTNQEQLIRARLAILIMAAELKNVARVCRLAGVSRSRFYAMKKAYELNGKEGLAPRVRRKPDMPNRTPASLEERILRHTRRSPLVSYVRLARDMKSDEGNVTPAMVRYVWQRHGLSTRSARIEWTRGASYEASPDKPANAPYKVPVFNDNIQNSEVDNLVAEP
jgi:hypothetical protein